MPRADAIAKSRSQTSDAIAIGTALMRVLVAAWAALVRDVRNLNI
jgi:hypothetical protein